MVRHVLVLALALAGCTFPARSGELACRATADCDDGRICERGFCVAAEDLVVDAAADDSRGDPIDAAVDAPPPPPDADPFVEIAMQCAAAGYVADQDGALHRRVTGGAEWPQAQADCADDVPGATHLVVLSSQAEVALVAARPGWIGLSDRAAEGTFVTVTGEPDDLRPFDSGQPDNGSGSEDCVEMRSNGKLNDEQCDEGRRYVCECDGRASL